MRTIEEHRAAIDALVAPVLAALGSTPDGREDRSVDDLAAQPLAGHAPAVLAVGVTAPIDLPPFDNSQMDGFAVRVADAPGPLRVVAPIAAGSPPPPLAPDTAAPIMTGAPIPAGADAVVPVEQVPPGVFPDALHLATVTIDQPPAVGTFVRRRGSDLPAGAVLAAAGTACTPAVLGLLAAAGVPRVTVVRRPRVLVVSTGSEVAPPGPGGGAEDDATGPGAEDRAATHGAATRGAATRGAASGGAATIGDANGASLRAALAEVGAETRAIRVPDDVERFRAEVDRAVGDWADLVVTTGGISMGAFEVVREALEPVGLTVTSVAMQPGGPQAFGTVQLGARPVPVVAFPGNPVSALVSFEVFLRPAFARHAGLAASRPVADLPSAEAVDSPPGKHQIRRGRVEDGAVHFVGGASSHLLAHLADATHLVHVPVGVESVAPGDVLTTWRIR